MEKQLIVVDEGSAQIKVIWNDNASMKHLVIPSRIVQDTIVDSSGEYSPASYLVDGMDYSYNPDVDNVLPTDSPSYQTSDYNRVLIHEALRQAGFGGKTVDVVTTLPVGQFFRIKPNDAALIARKKQNVLGSLKSMRGEPLATIDQCRVSPEAIPAWNDARMDEQGNIKPEYIGAKRMMLVDIGGTTTDMTLLTNNQLEAHCSIHNGVFELRAKLQGMLHTDPEINVRHFTESQIDHILKTRKFAGVDVSGHVINACKALATMIKGQMESLERGSETLDYVVYAGGGAALVGDMLDKEYGGRSVFPEQPELSIARGVYKAEMRKQRKAVKETANET